MSWAYIGIYMGKLWICAVHMLFWVALSGRFDQFFLSSGAVCSVLVVVLRNRLDAAVPKDNYSAHPCFQSSRPLVVAKKLLQYCCWLGWQIILSAWFVTKAGFRSKTLCSPVITTMSVPHNNGLELFMLTNSVTATPGTVGMTSIPDGRVRVLALDRSLLGGVLEISGKIRRIFHS